MRRGEVWWARPELAGGSQKLRPFVVVSHDVFNRNERYPKVMVVHVTSVHRVGGPFAWEVELPRGAGGLSAQSVVKCGEVYTLLKANLAEQSGVLPRRYIEEVDRALAVALGLRA